MPAFAPHVLRRERGNGDIEIVDRTGRIGGRVPDAESGKPAIHCSFDRGDTVLRRGAVAVLKVAANPQSGAAREQGCVDDGVRPVDGMSLDLPPEDCCNSVKRKCRELRIWRASSARQRLVLCRICFAVGWFRRIERTPLWPSRRWASGVGQSVRLSRGSLAPGAAPAWSSLPLGWANQLISYSRRFGRPSARRPI